MLTLHVVAEKTKKILKLGGISIVVILFLFWLVGVVKQLKETLYPTPPPPPTVSFGKLPAIVFPSNEKRTYTYSLETTLTGTLPTFPTTAIVHTLFTPEPTLLSLKKATEQVSIFGFTQGGAQTAAWTYAWQDTSSPPKSITMDILYKTYSIVTNGKQFSPIIDRIAIPEEEAAKKKANDLISTISGFPLDVDTNNATIRYYKSVNGELVETTEPVQRDALEIYYFQNPVNDLPIYYPNPPYSTMRFLFGEKNDLISADYYYYYPQEEQGTYPIKTAQEAFDELQKGGGYIASPPSQPTEHIGLKQIFLAYYLGKEEQSYLMPIIVFQGENNFFAYVSAVRPDWIQP